MPDTASLSPSYEELADQAAALWDRIKETIEPELKQPLLATAEVLIRHRIQATLMDVRHAAATDASDRAFAIAQRTLDQRNGRAP